MNIRMEYSALPRSRAGCASETVDIEDGAGLPELLEAVALRHGEAMRQLLFSEDGRLSRTILCFVDNEQADWAQPPSLGDGACVMLMSPISGG